MEARSEIGRYIVYRALAAVTILGLGAIYAGVKEKENFEFAKDILSMLLPVTGAWVGTVLAFHFSRENYAAATENNAVLLGLTMEQRLQSISVEDAMLRMS